MIKRGTDIRICPKINKHSYVCVLVSMELSFHWKEIENGRDRRLEQKAQHHLYLNLPMRWSVPTRHTDKGNTDNMQYMIIYKKRT